MPIRISAKNIGLDILQPIAIVHLATLSTVREAKHQAHSNRARRITYPRQPCPTFQPDIRRRKFCSLVKLSSIMSFEATRAARDEHCQLGSHRHRGYTCILIYVERQNFTCIQPTSSRQHLPRHVKLRYDEELFNHGQF